MEIFSSTMPSAKSSRPRAIAPTKTATECVSGMVLRWSDKRTVLASADRATTIERVEFKVDHARLGSSLILYVFGGRWSVIGF